MYLNNEILNLYVHCEEDVEAMRLKLTKSNSPNDKKNSCANPSLQTSFCSHSAKTKCTQNKKKSKSRLSSK